MTRIELGRRDFLRGVAGTVAIVAGGSALAGCGGGGKTANTSSENTKVTLPSYAPYTSVKPDLPGNTEIGVQDGYLTYPAHPVRAIKTKPGKGGTVTAFTTMYTALPPALGRNQYWQALNDRLGAKLAITMVPSSDYTEKLATTIAGGDLPDFLQIEGEIAQLPSLLAAKCQNLDKYLGGKAAADYPFLANIPNEYWKSCVYNGGIYGLPIPRSRMGSMMYRRDDLLAKIGADPNPASFAEFKSLCKQVTDENKNRWAMANPAGTVNFIQQMLGSAAGWKEEGGKLTSAYELPEAKEAIAAVADLMKAGYVHPDAFAIEDNTANFKEWLVAGNAVMDYDNYTAWAGFYSRNTSGPSFKVDGMLPPNYDSGSTANTWQGPLDFSFTALRKSDDGRIHELLNVANWLAAPFGTEEYLFRGNGIPGVHYTMQKGIPVHTDKGDSELGLPLGYIAQPPQVQFGEYVQATRDTCAFEAKFLPKSVADPTQGLFSDTYSRKWAQLDDQITDARAEILQGRKPVSAWDEALDSWRNDGADAVRHEFEEALQKQ